MRQSSGELRVDVLGPDRALIAAFASPIEAYRYAALIYQPPFVPTLRRASDGATWEFQPASGVSKVKAWLDVAERGRISPAA